MEQFKIECRKTKTKVTHQSRQSQATHLDIPVNQSKLT